MSKPINIFQKDVKQNKLIYENNQMRESIKQLKTNIDNKTQQITDFKFLV